MGARCETSLRDEGDVGEVELCEVGSVLRLLSGDERCARISENVRCSVSAICKLALSFCRYTVIFATCGETGTHAAFVQKITGCVLTHDGGLSKAVVSGCSALSVEFDAESCVRSETR